MLKDRDLASFHDCLARLENILDGCLEREIIDAYTRISIQLIARDFVATWNRFRVLLDGHGEKRLFTTHDLVTTYTRFFEHLDAELVYRFLTGEQCSFLDWIDDPGYASLVNGQRERTMEHWSDDLENAINESMHANKVE